jgi:methionyl-tRNA formyltransferase
MTTPLIILATPHARHDRLEVKLRERLLSYQILRIRDRQDLTSEKLSPLSPEFIFFPHWSWLIPDDIYSKFECLIFHMTDLPYGRGGSPLQNLIVRGHKETMLSAIRCEKGIDAGPIYLKEPLSLSGTAEEILMRASIATEKMIVEIVEKRPLPIPQQGNVVEFKRRRAEDGDIAGLKELNQVYDFIRMLDGDGYPRAFLQTAHFHFEFSDALFSEHSIEANVRIRKLSND